MPRLRRGDTVASKQATPLSHAHRLAHNLAHARTRGLSAKNAHSRTRTPTRPLALSWLARSLAHTHTHARTHTHRADAQTDAHARWQWLTKAPLSIAKGLASIFKPIVATGAFVAARESGRLQNAPLAYCANLRQLLCLCLWLCPMPKPMALAVAQPSPAPPSSPAISWPSGGHSSARSCERRPVGATARRLTVLPASQPASQRVGGSTRLGAALTQHPVKADVSFCCLAQPAQWRRRPAGRAGEPASQSKLACCWATFEGSCTRRVRFLLGGSRARPPARSPCQPGRARGPDLAAAGRAGARNLHKTFRLCRDHLISMPNCLSIASYRCRCWRRHRRRWLRGCRRRRCCCCWRRRSARALSLRAGEPNARRETEKERRQDGRRSRIRAQVRGICLVPKVAPASSLPADARALSLSLSLSLSLARPGRAKPAGWLARDTRPTGAQSRGGGGGERRGN